MKKTPTQLQIIWEHQKTDDAEDRLLVAFEMLFADIPVGLLENEGHLTEAE